MPKLATPGIDYGPVRGPEEVEIHARNMAWSFNAEEEDLHAAFERYGTDKLRVLREGGAPVAGYSLLPLGQWYGGRLLEMAGISLVGVSPEHRGKGAATRLMEAAVRECREAGYPISVLYPAKQTLYRRVGYEQAGGRYRTRIGAADLGIGDRELAVRAIDGADRTACEELYRAHARRHNGTIDRPDFLWKRITEPPKKKVRGFLAEGEDGVEGYVWIYESAGEGVRHDLNLTDFVARTNRAALRLLRFLGDHASLAREVVWFGSPADPLVALLPEQSYEQRLFFHWMIRIVDVVKALEGRGYPRGREAELHLAVDDGILEENRGDFVLEVSDGRGEVHRGGSGRIRADVRGLGAIYTGFLSPEDALVAGLLRGPAADLDLAGSVFGGPSPWMSDMF
jgi:predicted acetyltransferase